MMIRDMGERARVATGGLVSITPGAVLYLLANQHNAGTIASRMAENEIIRKTVGKPRARQDVFERIRALNRSLEKIGVKTTEDGEPIRRVVGRPRR
jgi:hypothetical protein